LQPLQQKRSCVGVLEILTGRLQSLHGIEVFIFEVFIIEIFIIEIFIVCCVYKGQVSS
jgi:hypothetical protein